MNPGTSEVIKNLSPFLSLFYDSDHQHVQCVSSIMVDIRGCWHTLSSHSTGVTRDKIGSSLRTGALKLFLSPGIKKAPRIVTFENWTKDTLFCVYASLQFCNLRSQLSELTDSAAQTKQGFHYNVGGFHSKKSVAHMCVLDTLKQKHEMPSAMSMCCDNATIVWLFGLFNFHRWHKYCAIILHIIAAD